MTAKPSEIFNVYVVDIDTDWETVAHGSKHRLNLAKLKDDAYYVLIRRKKPIVYVDLINSDITENQCS